jgi:hypothetical protein
LLFWTRPLAGQELLNQLARFVTRCDKLRNFARQHGAMRQFLMVTVSSGLVTAFGVAGHSSNSGSTSRPHQGEALPDST